MPHDRRPEIPMLSEAEERVLQAQIADDPDAAELTDDQLAHLRPAREVLPPALYAALVGEEATAETAVSLTIRVDRDVLEAFKASGEDWQARMNDALAREAKRLSQTG